MLKRFTNIILLISLILIMTCDKDNPTESVENVQQQLNTPPTASFTVSPTSGQIGTTFQHDASGCTDNEDATSAL
jgi:hypothetical protein